MSSLAARRQVDDTFSRHRGPITSVAGVPGRRAAITGGYDAAVAYVDLDRATLELLGYHDHLVNAVSVNAAGTMAASCSSDYTICLWDLRRREPIRLLRGHHDDVNGFVFLSDTRGASASHDHRIYVWDLQTGAVVNVLEGHAKYVMSIDGAGRYIYSSGDDMTLRQWDVESGRELRCWGPFEVETDSCAIDARRRRVILGADDGVIRVFDTHSGTMLGQIEAHTEGIKRVAVCPTTGRILSAAYDQRLRVWDGETLTHYADLPHSQTVWERSLSFTPDGREILGGSFDGTVFRWSMDQTGESPTELGVKAGADAGAPGNVCINDVSARADGDVAFVSDDGLLRVARVAQGTLQVVAKAAPLGGRVLMNAVTLGAGTRVFAGAHDQHLHLFERTDGALDPIARVAIGEGPINCVRAGHGRLWLACYGGAVVCADLDGRVVARHDLHEGAVKALRLHPTLPLGISCSADGQMIAWELDGRVRARFCGHVAIADDLDIDPSGRRVVSVSRDFTLKVYDIDSERLVAAHNLGQKSPKSVCFWTHDVVVVGNYWGCLSRYELDSGRVTRARIADNGVSSLSRAGELLIAASYDGALYMIDPELLEVVDSARLMNQRVVCPTVAELLAART